MLENLLTKQNLIILCIILLVILGIYYFLREGMENVMSIQHKDDYQIPAQMEDLVEKSINENSVVMNTNILKPLSDDTEQSYPNIYKNSKITITPQPELEKQEFPAIVQPPLKPLQEMLEY